ncbi:MAG TPA: 1-deoxy-D-xylulose-5-phosphate reductoisomerase [Terriglobales bacterium]|jgi:1-deoxy-D-xylulose-5-phosphate reductoisomerase
MLKTVAVLGSTGSIGRNTLEVIAAHPDRFQVVALAAGDNVRELAAQIQQFHPRLAVLRTAAGCAELRRLLPQAPELVYPELLYGAAGLRAAAVEAGAAIVVAATVGVAALPAIHAALAQGVSVALANKEALVAAGTVLMAAAARGGAELLPIDSEHSAIHQCLRSGHAGELARLLLTASGGPLLRRPLAELAGVTAIEALRHPTWNMGARISLDSATMMNKGFEIIEACHLFGVREAQVEVLVHPQSIVHSLVEFADGSVLAQLGAADMRLPIQYALTYPERLPCPGMRLKLEEVGRLEFEPPSLERFPCLGLARAASRAGGGAPAALNAADEVAAAAFLAGEIGFAEIAPVVERTLDRVGAPPVPSLEAVLAVDAEARRIGKELIKGRKSA